MASRERSSGMPHPSTAAGGDGAEAPAPIFSVTGWSSSHLAGVTATGELDLWTAPWLDAEMAAVCGGDSSEVRDFLLDLGGVTFLDSAGLRAANRAERAGRNRGWRVRVTAPTAPAPRHLMILARRNGQSSQEDAQDSPNRNG